MAHELEKNYSSFAGLDTRSNKLLQNPKSFRQGSKNFRYNFQDEIVKANGFQRKDSGEPSFVDIFEYKYRDVNTGASATEVLGVATDGILYRKKNYFLRFSAHGAATSVSMYYDEVTDSFKMDLNGLGSIAIGDAMTLQDSPSTTASLIGALNALAGVTAIIVDDSGTTVTGAITKLAHLLDCKITDTTFADNPVYYWEAVPYPGSTVPFAIAQASHSNSDYEGISTVNLNNSIYITDGGFPFKYDGKTVYRAGMPRTPQKDTDSSGYNGLVFSAATGTSWTSGTHLFLVRLRFRDVNGFTVLGKPQPTDLSYAISGGSAIGANSVALSGATSLLKIETKEIKNEDNFPVFSCKINNGAGYTLTGAAPYTLTVDSGHNIKVGMCLRLHYTSTVGVDSRFSAVNTYVFYAKVSSVAATSITLETSIPSGSLVLVDNTLIQGCYVPDDMVGKTQGSTMSYNYEDSNNWYGASYVLYATKAGIGATGTFYEVANFPIPHVSSHNSDVYIDCGAGDSSLLIEFDSSEGEDLPRACSYLGKWQDQLVQAGRPYDETLSTDYYPTVYSPPHNSGVLGAKTQVDINFDTYTESHLCDFQSVYWNNPLSPEGFPQDGLHEISIDTRFSDRVKGLAQNKDSLFVFKERSTGLVVGDIGTNDVQLEILETDAGCSSHRSIQDVGGHVVWLDGSNGFYSCVAGRLPELIGFPIQDYMKVNSLGLNFTKAVACNFQKENLYICAVGSTTFVYDYTDDGNLQRNCWYLWDRIDTDSILATSDDILLVNDGTRTWKMKLTGTKYDMTDHKSAISFILNTAWHHAGAPTIDKRYIGLWINSIQGGFTATVKQYGNFLSDVIASQSNVTFLAESSSKKAIKEFVKSSLPKLSGVSFGIENSEKNKLVIIQGIELEYAAEYDGGEPRK